MAAISLALQKIQSSPCYLVLCSGLQTDVIERDLNASTIRSNSEFIVHTNHDEKLPPSTAQLDSDVNPIASPDAASPPGALDWFIEDSEYRAACVSEKWGAVKTKHENAQKIAPTSKPPSIVLETLVKWVRTYPTMNESSHFGCIMDPRSGTIKMLEREGLKKFKQRPNMALTVIN